MSGQYWSRAWRTDSYVQLRNACGPSKLELRTLKRPVGHVAACIASSVQAVTCSTGWHLRNLKCLIDDIQSEGVHASHGEVQWIGARSQDEVLAHRLGMVPINVDPRKIDFKSGVHACPRYLPHGHNPARMSASNRGSVTPCLNIPASIVEKHVGMGVIKVGHEMYLNPITKS